MSHEMLSQEGGNPGQQETREDLKDLHFKGSSRVAGISIVNILVNFLGDFPF